MTYIHRHLRLAAMLFFAVSISAIAQNNTSQKRYALVIGVKNYSTVAPLRNSLNDARAVATAH